METIQVEMQLRANGVTMFLIKKEYKIGVQSCLTKVDKNHVQGVQNLCPPSRAKSRKASVKLTISPSNTFNSKWGRQKLAPETF